MVHYIAMSGSTGCIPDSVCVFDDIDQAIQWFEDSFNNEIESDIDRTEFFNDLVWDHFHWFRELSLPDYCEIQICTCNTPKDHED